MKKRELLHNNNLNAQYKLPKQISNIKSFKTSQIVASFISIKTEISLKILNNFLEISQKKICLPVIKEDLNYLIFREFNKNTILIEGKYNIPEPVDSSRELLPDFVLVPCLAFDQFGYRLGYGAGYYDRLIQSIKKKKKIITIGLAFDFQELFSIPVSKYDQKLDYIITNKNVLK